MSSEQTGSTLNDKQRDALESFLIDDALTFIAGLMRVRFDVFLTLTAIGKGSRYAVLLGLVNWLGGPHAALS